MQESLSQNNFFWWKTWCKVPFSCSLAARLLNFGWLIQPAVTMQKLLRVTSWEFNKFVLSMFQDLCAVKSSTLFDSWNEIFWDDIHPKGDTILHCKVIDPVPASWMESLSQSDMFCNTHITTVPSCNEVTVWTCSNWRSWIQNFFLDSAVTTHEVRLLFPTTINC